MPLYPEAATAAEGKSKRTTDIRHTDFGPAPVSSAPRPVLRARFTLLTHFGENGELSEEAHSASPRLLGAVDIGAGEQLNNAGLWITKSKLKSFPPAQHFEEHVRARETEILEYYITVLRYST